MFDTSVFVNCPFDTEYAPLLEAILFCIVNSGLTARLANERLENGENRFDKIVEMARQCKYSIHDLSRCKSEEAGEFLWMNMPFELGLDFGIRLASNELPSEKKFLIFEKEPYDLKRALSDLSGQDVEFHRNDYQNVIKKVRDFLKVEANLNIPGPALIRAQYETFQAWMLELKIHEGHSEREALQLPTRERLEAMKAWVETERPDSFVPV